MKMASPPPQIILSKQIIVGEIVENAKEPSSILFPQ
jgi:hypothetical protein